ncbi:MAG TPA: thymidylate synthase [Candidatus Nanoarchaeia archaeon]|nr:thymidylate synthase [Candidatus Nanoarchaeia archaeon]
MEIVQGEALKAWKLCLQRIWSEGREFKDQEGRICKEVTNVMVRVENPELGVGEPAQWLANQEEWVYPSLEQINKVILGESNSAFFHYAYGERIFRFQGKKNQLQEFILPLLSKNIESRRALLSLYDPIEDSEGLKDDVPCLVAVHFRVIEGKVHVSGYIRSNDVFIGWPANVYQLFVLQKWVTSKLGLEFGSITTISGSAHIFLEYQEKLDRLINVVSY